MATFRSRRGQPQTVLLARTVGQLVDRNRELKKRQDELEKRIRELEAMRASMALRRADKPGKEESKESTGQSPQRKK